MNIEFIKLLLSIFRYIRSLATSCGIISIILALYTYNKEYWALAGFSSLIVFLFEIIIRIFNYLKRKKQREIRLKKSENNF